MSSVTARAAETAGSTTLPSPNNVQFSAIHGLLDDWYKLKGRDLPWRKTRDPYHTLVAEFMLQQTGVARVLPAYEAFLERFPTVQALALASAGDVIRAWSGLGYNRRAINLQRSARAIVDDHCGSVPSDPETLRRLPGIGPYTAAAIACFAFERPVAVMDTNIRRVLDRLFLGRHDIDATTGWRLAETALPESGAEASSWHQALMDLGATVCTARRPTCDTCPVNDLCAGRPLFVGADSPTITYAELSDATPQLRVAERRSPSSYAWIGTSRYYRGRIVEALRRHPTGAHIDALGPLVRDDYSASQHGDWLGELLAGLERDGLVAVNGDGVRLPE